MPQPTSDHDGIVKALVLNGRGGATEVGWPEVDAWTPAQGALWLQLDVASPRAAAWLDAHHLTMLRLNDRWPRVKVVDDETIVFGVRAWLPTSRPGSPGPGVTNLYLQPMRAVVVSRGLLPELPPIVERLAAGTGPATIPALAIEQLDQVVQRLTDAGADLKPPLADLEFDATAGADNQEEMRSIGWQIANLLRYVTPARVVVDRLLAVRPMWLIGHALPRVEAIAEDLRAEEAQLQTLMERVGTVRELLGDRRAERMNEILYTLTIISSIMLPLTFITGLFGINIGIAGASYGGMSSTLAFLLFFAALAIIAWLEYRFIVSRHILIRTRPPRRPREHGSSRAERR